MYAQFETSQQKPICKAWASGLYSLRRTVIKTEFKFDIKQSFGKIKWENLKSLTQTFVQDDL